MYPRLFHTDGTAGMRHYCDILNLSAHSSCTDNVWFLLVSLWSEHGAPGWSLWAIWRIINHPSSCASRSIWSLNTLSFHQSQSCYCSTFAQVFICDFLDLVHLKNPQIWPVWSWPADPALFSFSAQPLIFKCIFCAQTNVHLHLHVTKRENLPFTSNGAFPIYLVILYGSYTLLYGDRYSSSLLFKFKE